MGTISITTEVSSCRDELVTQYIITINWWPWQEQNNQLGTPEVLLANIIEVV